MTDTENIEELLSELDISERGKMTSTGAYTIDLPNYNKFAVIHSKLEHAESNGQLEQMEDSTVMNIHNTNVVYITVDDNEENPAQYTLSLLGDLDQDIYQLVINKF